VVGALHVRKRTCAAQPGGPLRTTIGRSAAAVEYQGVGSWSERLCTPIALKSIVMFFFDHELVFCGHECSRASLDHLGKGSIKRTSACSSEQRYSLPTEQ